MQTDLLISPAHFAAGKWRRCLHSHGQLSDWGRHGIHARPRCLCSGFSVGLPLSFSDPPLTHARQADLNIRFL